MIPNNVQPNLHLLNPEQINEVHINSVKLLEQTGIKVESKTARQLFEKSDAVKIKEDIVFIQRELIEQAIKTAPSNIEVFRKDGKSAFNLGTRQAHQTPFGIGVTNAYFQDIETNQIEPFSRKHMQHSAKLGDLLPNYDLVSTIGVPSEVQADKLDLYNTLDMYANTAKPLVLLILEDKKINQVFDLLSHLHGDISAKPFCIPYFNPITPLIMNAATTDKMIASINRHLPIMYSNYSMYGASTPVTEAGSLVLLNAELLAGLVFSQLVREGAEVILGSLPAAFNMKTMASTYTPASYLLNLACAEMMHFYMVPHCGTSGSGNGWAADLSASGDLWQNHLTSCISNVGCVPFVGGNFDSMAFSPATVVLSDYIIGEVKKFANGFTINEQNINIAEMDQIGHGGNYLTSEQTLASLADIRNADPIWPSLQMDAWKEQGMPKAEKFLIDRTRDLYAKALKESENNLEIIKKGEAYLNNSH